MQKNLNDIILPSRRRAMMEGEKGLSSGITLNREQMPLQTPPPPVLPPRPPKRSRMSDGSSRRFPIGTAIVAFLVVVGSVGVLFAFSGAKVAVTPTQNVVQVTSTLTAAAGEGDLPFGVVVVEKTATNSVESESTENVTQSAQGTITVTNAQEASQALIKNTRFETPEGLIFRIKDSISVPPQKNGTPGSLTVTVYADEAGERHNVGPTTFTLPGLKGSDTYTKVTARSSESMQGGFLGARPAVGQATKNAENAKLQSTLESQLKTELQAQVKPGYVLIPGGTAFVYEMQPDTAGVGNSVTLTTKGSARGVVFPEEALARAIAFQSVGTYSGQPLTFKSLDALSLAPNEGLIPVVGDTTFSFTLTGSTTLVWKIDTSRIAAAVAGKSRSGAHEVLEGFPEVEGALLVLKPFWKNTFPVEPAKITVTIEGKDAKNAKK